jgi:hypothetical protein
MATVMERNSVTTVGKGNPGAARPRRRSITLNDLVTAIQDVVGPEDDGLVVATVRHLLCSGLLIRLGSHSALQCPSRRQRRQTMPTRLRRSSEPTRQGPRAPCLPVPEAHGGLRNYLNQHAWSDDNAPVWYNQGGLSWTPQLSQQFGKFLMMYGQ